MEQNDIMSLYRKHRPQKFRDLIGQDHIRDTLMQAVLDGQLSHAYLFTGPRGTGKTTAARLIAKVANCHEIEESKKAGKKFDAEPCDKCESCKDILSGKSIDIIEIDAASNRGIDEIRELRENVKFAPAKSKFKVYIIDEVHMLTREAFNALLKTLEEPPAHAIFILATTEAHKVPATIISRTQRFDFKRIGKDDLSKNLKKIAKEERIEIDDDAVSMIVSAAEGGARDAISLLDQVSGISKRVDAEVVRNILGLVKSEEVFKLLGAIFNTKPEEGLKIAHRLFEDGHDMASLNKQIIETLRRIMIYLMSGSFLFEDTKENEEEIKSVSQRLEMSGHGADKARRLIEIFVESGKLLKDVSYPILPIEIAVIEGTSIFNPNPKPEALNPPPAAPDAQHLRAGNKIPSSKSEISNEKTEDKKEVRNEKVEMRNENKEDVPESSSLISQSSKLEAQTSSLKPHLSELAAQPSAPVLEMTIDTWQKIITEIKKENSSLAALLRDSKPLGSKGDKLMLGVKFKFHKDKISELKNIKIIEDTIKELTGKGYILEVKIADLRSKPEKPASDDELQKAAEEIFS